MFNDNGGMFMPVAPAYYGGGGNNNGGGFLGGEGIWAIIILAMLFNGGFGGFGGFGGGYGAMMGMGMADGWGLYPWLNNSEHISDGFRDQILQDSVTSVRDGIANLSTQLCNCCGDMQMALANGFAGVEQGANTRQIANMQQAFAAQTAMAQGFSGVNAGVADLRYTVATEACADRAAVGDALQNVTMQNVGNTNQIVNAITAGIQSIKDDLCADRLDAERRENQNLRTQLSMAQLAASQTAQNATIIDGVYNRLSTCPVDTTPVYGRQPIFTCPVNVGNNGGCGCNGNFLN